MVKNTSWPSSSTSGADTTGPEGVVCLGLSLPSRICAEKLEAFKKSSEGYVERYCCLWIVVFFGLSIGLGRIMFWGVEGECGEEFVVEEGMPWEKKRFSISEW